MVCDEKSKKPPMCKVWADGFDGSGRGSSGDGTTTIDKPVKTATFTGVVGGLASLTSDPLTKSNKFGDVQVFDKDNFKGLMGSFVAMQKTHDVEEIKEKLAEKRDGFMAKLKDYVDKYTSNREMGGEDKDKSNVDEDESTVKDTSTTTNDSDMN